MNRLRIVVSPIKIHRFQIRLFSSYLASLLSPKYNQFKSLQFTILKYTIQLNTINFLLIIQSRRGMYRFLYLSLSFSTAKQRRENPKESWPITRISDRQTRGTQPSASSEAAANSTRTPRRRKKRRFRGGGAERNERGYRTSTARSHCFFFFFFKLPDLKDSWRFTNLLMQSCRLETLRPSRLFRASESPQSTRRSLQITEWRRSSMIFLIDMDMNISWRSNK